MAVAVTGDAAVDSDFEALLAQSEAEEREERELRQKIAAPSFDLPPTKKEERERTEMDPEAFLADVSALLVAIAPKRADHKPFTDRCVVCERRGVHNKARMRCDCPCHRVRAYLE